MLTGDELPCAPNNDRILVKPDPPRETSDGGLIIPEIGQLRAHFGVVIHAGLKARDMMYDHGHEIGDRIWWGQFAGVWEEWDHITKPGNGQATETRTGGHPYRDPPEVVGGAGCQHPSWSRAPSPGDRMQAFTCDACKAYRIKEPVLIMNVEDILGNETLEERIRSGESRIAFGQTPAGVTQHYIAKRDPATVTTTKETRRAV